MKLSITGRIARRAAARPWLTIGIWAVALVAAIALAGGLGSALTQNDRNLVTTESDTAAELATQLRGDSAPDTEIVIVKSATAVYGDADFDAAIATAIDATAAVAGVDAVTPPAPTTSVSADGHSALVTATLGAQTSDDTGQALLDALRQAQPAGFQYLAFGEKSAEATFGALAEDTLMRGEAIGISVALVILVLVFGALVAAGIPLLVALVSIAAAVGATAIVGSAFDLSFFIVNMITMMGLALGIDYSLVTVQRFREELAHGRSPHDAVAIAGNTANRAVLFSGSIVVVSLAGLVMVPNTIMRSLGAGAIIVALTSVVTALTLLPAVLRLLGTRINAGRIPGARPGREPRTWAAIAKGVTARPALALGAGLAITVTLALPLASMRLAFPGWDALPQDNAFRQAVTTLVDDFDHGREETFVVVTGGNHTPVDALADRIDTSDAFTDTAVEWYGDAAIITTHGTYDGADARADAAIDTLRTAWVPDAMAGSSSTAYVGGQQAGSVDFVDILAKATPWVVLFVLGTSFVLLLVTFRSVVIAGTAIALNVLSAAAAFGVLVAVCQWGWGADLLGVVHAAGIAPWLPLFLFAVLFGLSMDYHVFLLSRIKEHHDAGADTRTAVIHGLSRTGSLITGAALIMVAVFLGFALGDLAEFAQMGLGLAAAVLIDATIIRALMVPAIMTLLGSRNWYLPAWLSWLPHMRIEAPEPAPAEDTGALVTVPA